MLTLKQFIVRAEVLKLYRNILQTVRQIPDQYYRKEMRQWAHDDFKKHKHLTDELTIQMMINKGKMSLRELEQSLNLAKCSVMKRELIKSLESQIYEKKP